MKALAFAVLSLAVLLLSAGCAQKAEPTVQEPAPPVIAPLENATAAQAPCSTGNPVQNDACFLMLAKSASDPQACRNIYSIDQLDSCYALFADSDLEICKKITGTDARDACLAKNAKAQKSDGICGLIADMGRRTECLGGILPKCMLLNIEDRALCSAVEKGDYTLCDTDGCLQQYAVNTSDSGACGRIAKENERLYCEAMVGRSADACKKASISAMRDWCVQNAAIALGDLASCDLATEGSGYRNNCYLHFAVKMNDSGVCRRSAPEEMRDDCYANYSVQTATVTACPKVVESNSQVGCYYKAARLNRMPSLCNPLLSGSWRTSCYSMSIMLDAGPVPSDCAGVENLDWKDQCYRAAALKAYNQTYCGSMRPGPEKNACDSLFQ